LVDPRKKVRNVTFFMGFSSMIGSLLRKKRWGGGEVRVTAGICGKAARAPR
jgi:hypothetical protein